MISSRKLKFTLLFLNPLNLLLFSWRDSCLSEGMKNLFNLIFSTLLTALLVGCGGIDSVPLPDNTPDESATNAGAGADDLDPADGAGANGDSEATEDGDSTFVEPLQTYIVSLDSQLFLAPSRSLEPTQSLVLESADGQARTPGDVSQEGAANASLDTLPDGVINNVIDGTVASTWMLDSTWLPNERAGEAINDLLALAADPFKREGIFIWSQCGEASCLTVTDASLSGEVLVVGVFSQALERGVVKNISSELIQIPLPPNSEGAAWKVVVGSSAQAPYVGEIVTLSPPSWD